jgi:hypothetical protein
MQTNYPHAGQYTYFLHAVKAPGGLAVRRILPTRPRKLPRTASGGVPRRSIVVVGEVAHLLLCQLIDNSMALLPIVAAGIMLLIRAATCTCPPLAPSRPGCWTCYKSGPTLGQESGVLGESGADAAPSSGDGL